MTTMYATRYLGDSVYASFDGYQVWLHLNRHDAEPIVALEANVILALLSYYEGVSGRRPLWTKRESYVFVGPLDSRLVIDDSPA